MDDLYTSVYGDLGIALDYAHQWWRVDLMYRDWKSLCKGDVLKEAVVEQAYNDFEQVNHDRTPLPTL